MAALAQSDTAVGNFPNSFFYFVRVGRLNLESCPVAFVPFLRENDSDLKSLFFLTIIE